MPVPALSEWTPIDGVVKWCVQASETIVAATYGKLSDTYQSGLALVRDQQRHGEAGPGGASNWANASAQLTRIGVPNTAFGPGSPSGSLPHNWPAVLSAAVASGRPVLVGIPHAYNLQDVQTGAHYDAGVWGHAVTVVGQDALGFVVADPNAPQAQHGGYVHYSAAGFAAAGIDSLVIPNNPPSGDGIGSVLGAAAGGVGGAALNGGLGDIVAAAVGAPGVAVGTGASDALGALVGGVGGVSLGWQGFIANMLERGVFIIVGLILIVFGLAFFLFGSRGAQPSRAGRVVRTAGAAAAFVPK